MAAAAVAGRDCNGGGGGGGGDDDHSAAAVIALSAACAALALVAATMCLVDVPYFMRSLYAYVAATRFRRPLSVLDTAVYASACLTTDLDVYLSHMNNARYLRDVDLARIDFVLRTGLWRELRHRGAFLYTVANAVRYRKFVRPFSRYDIRSRLVYWDDMSLFFEHRFVTRADGFVRAVVFNRQRVCGCAADDLVRAVVGAKAGAGPVQRPECPAEIQHWIQFNLVSSTKLKAEAGCDNVVGEPLTSPVRAAGPAGSSYSISIKP